MLKVRDRFIACLLAVALSVVLFTACARTPSASPAAPRGQSFTPLGTATGTVEQANSRTMKYSLRLFNGGKFLIRAEMTEYEFDDDDHDNDTDIVFLAISDGKTYLNDLDEETAVISLGDTIYVLDTEDRTGYKITSSSMDIGIGGAFEIPEPDTAPSAFGCGTLVYNGVEYYFESSSDGSTTTYYCFDPADTNGDNLLYYITENTSERRAYRLAEVSRTVDESLFTVPAGYSITDYSALGGFIR